MRPESDFTRPNGWCPHPDRWRSQDAMGAESEVLALVVALVHATKPAQVVETGAWRGVTAEAIGQALAAEGRGRLLTIELDPDLAAVTAGRCAGLPVDVVCGSSLEVELPPVVDVAFLDSEPGLRAVEARRLLPVMPPGALIVVHDVAPHFSTWALLAEVPGLSSIRLRTPRGLAICEVL